MNSTQTCVKEPFACDEYFQLFLLCLPIKATLHCFAASWSKPWGVWGGAGRQHHQHQLQEVITDSSILLPIPCFIPCSAVAGTAGITKVTLQIMVAPLGMLQPGGGGRGGVWRYRLAVLADLTNGHYGLPSAQEVAFTSVREQEEEAEQKGRG